MDAKAIREFFKDLFGSRLIARLEEDLLRLRSDFEQRLMERDQTIAELRTEKAGLLAKTLVYERTIMPLASRQGAEIVAATKPIKPNFGLDFNAPPVLSKWQQVQADHERRLAEEEKLEQEKKTAKAG
jgi:hypothetical protein